MRTYAGITIGPIVDTMMLTSSPIGLWFASYFFSSITEGICEELQEKGYGVFSLPPGYVVKKHKKECPGIGRYHDRIYIVSETQDDVEKDIKAAIGSVIKKSTSDIKDSFDEESDEKIVEELNEYLQIHYVIIPEDQLKPVDPGKNRVAQNLAESLDMMELTMTVENAPDESHLRKLLAGEKNDRNKYLKNYPPLDKAASSPSFLLAKKEEDVIKIHDLKWLATHGKSDEDDDTYKFDKTERYFAIVQCDGDNMGGQLALQNGNHDFDSDQGSVSLFSEKCMKYTEQSAKIVSDFGGFVIYAGGDDLLFLAPVIGKSEVDGPPDTSVFSLCQKIADNFNRLFNINDAKTEKAKPSLSFGISINYYKYPLYEAFADARYLLFDVAKGFHKGRKKEKHKNNVAVRLNKRSGQSSGFVCCMNTNGDADDQRQLTVYSELLSFLDKYFIKLDKKEAERKNTTMHSVVYHLEEFEKLFEMAFESGRNRIKMFYGNMFDNAGQIFGKEMLDSLFSLSEKIHECDHNDGLNVYVKGITDCEDSHDAVSDVFTVTSILRIAKFFLEED